jgi:hypothetical protein
VYNVNIVIIINNFISEKHINVVNTSNIYIIMKKGLITYVHKVMCTNVYFIENFIYV